MKTLLYALALASILACAAVALRDAEVPAAENVELTPFTKFATVRIVDDDVELEWVDTLGEPHKRTISLGELGALCEAREAVEGKEGP